MLMWLLICNYVPFHSDIGMTVTGRTLTICHTSETWSSPISKRSCNKKNLHSKESWLTVANKFIYQGHVIRLNKEQNINTKPLIALDPDDFIKAN